MLQVYVMYLACLRSVAVGCVHVVLLHFFLPGRDVFLLLKGRMRGRRYMATGGVTTSRTFTDWVCVLLLILGMR